MKRHLALAAVLLPALVACGQRAPTRFLVSPAASTSGVVPVPPAPASSSASAASPTSAAQPVAPQGVVRLRASGPGPARVAPGTSELLALALTVENATTEPLELRALTPRARGRLDDPTGVLTARLAEDRDGDGRFDRNVDRVLATAGFQQDDGPLPFAPLRLPLAPGAALRLLVILDLGVPAVASDDLQLVLDPAAATALSLAGLPAAVEVEAPAGPVLRLGEWVEPHEAFALAGEALLPRAARDARGRTHVGVFQNHNLRSTVHYTVFDGRRWSPADEVSRSASSTAWNQDLAVDQDGLPTLAWEEWDGGPGDVSIRWSAFDPVGFRWLPSERVNAPGSGLRLAPRLLALGAGSGRAVHAVWEDHDVLTGGLRVHHARRDATGWSAIAEVSSAAAGVRAGEPALSALPGGAVLVSWAENGAGSEVRCRRLDPSGAWSPVEVVARAAGLAARPELLADGAVIHCAFQDGDEVLVARRDAQGWSAPVNVSRSPNVVSREAALAAHQGRLYLAWVEGNERLSVAEGQGGAFSAPLVLTRGPGARARPVFASEGERLRLLWQDRSLGRQRVFETWREPAPLEAPRAVAAPGGDPTRPAIALDAEGRARVAWSVDAGGNPEVFCAAEEGQGFGPAENVSGSASASHQPAVAAIGTRTLVVWEEDAPGGFELRWAAREAAGWSPPAAVGSQSPAYTPRLAADPDGTALLVYTARTAGGEFDLHLRRFDGHTFGPPLPLAPDPAASSWSPALARRPDGAGWAVAWEEERGPRRELRVALIDRTGAAQVAAVASAIAGQYAPRLTWAGADLHAAWVEDGRVKTAVRRAGQPAFEAPQELSAGGSWAPSLAVAGEDVALSWEQWTGGDARVLLSLLGPAGWSAPAPLDFSRGPARAPALIGAPWAGLRAVWVEPGRVVERARRER